MADIASDFQWTRDGGATIFTGTDDMVNARGEFVVEFGDADYAAGMVGARYADGGLGVPGPWVFNTVPLYKSVPTKLPTPVGFWVEYAAGKNILHYPPITDPKIGNQLVERKLSTEPDSKYAWFTEVDNKALTSEDSKIAYLEGYAYRLRYLPKPTSPGSLVSDWTYASVTTGAAPKPLVGVTAAATYNQGTAAIDVQWTLHLSDNAPALAVKTSRSRASDGVEEPYTWNVAAGATTVTETVSYPVSTLGETGQLLCQVLADAAYEINASGMAPALATVEVAALVPDTTVASLLIEGVASIPEGSEGSFVCYEVLTDGSRRAVDATWLTNDANLAFAPGSSSLQVPANGIADDSKTIQVTATKGGLTSNALSVTIVDVTVPTTPKVSVTGAYTRDDAAGKVYAEIRLHFVPTPSGSVRVNVKRSATSTGAYPGSSSSLVYAAGTNEATLNYTYMLADMTVDELKFDVVGGLGITVDTAASTLTYSLLPDTTPNPTPTPVTKAITKNAFIRDGAANAAVVQEAVDFVSVKKGGKSYNRQGLLGLNLGAAYTGAGTLRLNVDNYASLDANVLQVYQLPADFDPSTANWNNTDTSGAVLLGSVANDKTKAAWEVALTGLSTADGKVTLMLYQQDLNYGSMLQISPVTSAAAPTLTYTTTAVPVTARPFVYRVNKDKKGVFGAAVVNLIDSNPDSMGVYYDFTESSIVTTVNGVDSPNYNGFDITANRYFGPPNTTATGFACMDWEGIGWRTMKDNAAGSTAFQEYETKYIALVRYAKSKYPNVKWGFYGIPTRNWKQSILDAENPDGKWDNLLKECDVIYPSVYHLYSEDEANRSDQKGYIDRILKKCFYYKAKFPHLQVYAFEWERLHLSDNAVDTIATDLAGFTLTYGLAYLNPERYARYCSYIKESSAYGVQADGITQYTSGNTDSRGTKPWGEHGWFWQQLRRSYSSTDKGTAADYENMMYQLISALKSLLKL